MGTTTGIGVVAIMTSVCGVTMLVYPFIRALSLSRLPYEQVIGIEDLRLLFPLAAALSIGVVPASLFNVGYVLLPALVWSVAMVSARTFALDAVAHGSDLRARVFAAYVIPSLVVSALVVGESVAQLDLARMQLPNGDFGVKEFVSIVALGLVPLLGSVGYQVYAFRRYCRRPAADSEG